MRPGLIHTHEKRLILIPSFGDFHDHLAEPFWALMIQNTMVKAYGEETVLSHGAWETSQRVKDQNLSTLFKIMRPMI